MADLGTDWRLIDGTATAWFDAASLAAAARLAGRIDSSSSEIDLRAMGFRVRVNAAEQAAAVSAAARDLGLLADPAKLQQLSVVFQSPEPAAVEPFWRRALGYQLDGEDTLADPLRRDPACRFERSSDNRPLRNRIHLDVVRPAAVVAAAELGPASGPYGVCHADVDGNEVDLVPGDPLGAAEVADWQGVFSAMAVYRTSSAEQQAELVAAAAGLADDRGFPLLIDVRPGLVIIDSGKDQADAEAHGLALDFTELAGAIQAAARELGAVAEPAAPRFVQLFLDAADVASVRAFWRAVLGYVEDRRDGVSDIYDPRRLSPVVVFQELDAEDIERRRQRNRILVELAVAADAVAARLEAVRAAGGRVLDESDGRWRVADPEGNELILVSSA